MSTLKTGNITHPSSTGTAITLDASDNVTINGPTNFSSNALTGIASINGGQIGGNRNLVTNGSFTISQRGSSFTGVTSTAYHLDRFQTELTTLGTWTVTQEADGPGGFAYSLKYACTTADASPASGDTFRMVYKFEGQDLQHLQKGTANAKDCTLSFWVKSNKTGTGQFNVRDIDNNRGINKTYTIDSADTWEYKTITIQGDTTGTISNDNGSSFWLMWVFNSGTGNSSGTFNSDWHSFDFTDINASGTLAIGGSTSDYIQITGVQLEVGSQATPFEHRSYGDELRRCLRYYFDATTSNIKPYIYPKKYVPNYRWADVFYPVPMRATATVTLTKDDTGNYVHYYPDQYHWKGYVAVADASTDSHRIFEFKADAEL